MKISIREKIVLIILVVTLTLVTTMGFITYRTAKKIIIEDMKLENQNTINNIYDYFLRNFIEEMEYVIEYWAEDEAIVNYRNKPNQPKMVREIPEHFEEVSNQWHGFMSANPDMAWMYLGVEEDGSILINPLDPSMSDDYDCRERDWYIKAVENEGEVIWTDPYLDAGDSGETVVTAAKAVKRGDELVGVVAIDIKLSKFSEIVKNLVFGDEGYLMLMSNDGEIYAHPDTSMLLKNVRHEEWFQGTLEGREGTETYPYQEDKEQIVSYLKVPKTDWKLVGISRIDTRNMLIPIRKQVVLIASITVIITLIFGVIFSKAITKPVEEIMRVVGRISHGEMGIRTNIKTEDEFKVLGNKFNEMLQQIEELLEERNQYVRELTKKNQEIMQQNQEIVAFSEQTEAMNKELSNLLDEVRRNYISTVKALANSIEANDEYTRGHCERVRNITMAIARCINFSESDRSSLEFASLLHDIGKIGISSEVLNKEGKLTTEEYEMIKRHPKIAFDILEDVEFLKESREIIYQHHERIDGNGYPRRLKDEEISLSAKILAVADAYDAMTSIRPYRSEPLTKEEAIEELQNAKGTQFDEKIVNALITILNENEILLDSPRNADVS